jgi:hypothetical protein
MLFADALPEDQCESVSEGRGTLGAFIVPIAPVEFLGLDLISLSTTGGRTLSGKEATEVRLLLVDERGV